MTTNRQHRRAEQRRNQEALSRKVENRATSKRRARRMDNKKDAHEINRMRARRRFNVPDEPSWSQEIIQTIRLRAQALDRLFGSSETKPLGVVTIAEVVFVVFAVAIGVWGSKAYQWRSHGPETVRPSTNSTVLIGTQLDLVPFRQYVACRENKIRRCLLLNGSAGAAAR